MSSSNSLPAKPSFWEQLLQNLIHALIGAGAAAGAAYVGTGHVNPIVGAAVGSMASSIYSAYQKPPNQN